MVGCVIRTKLTVLEVCFEKVLSNTIPYMPSSPSGTSYCPIVTLSASHLPVHATDFSPMACSFSMTFPILVEARLDSFVGASSNPGVGGKVCEGSSVSGAGRFGVSPFLVPGCLKMPKLMLFFCGWTDHEME